MSNLQQLNPLNVDTLAPVPTSIAATGLSETFLLDLVTKHIFQGGTLDLRAVTERTGLHWKVTESLLTQLRAQALLDAKATVNGPVRFALTDKGRACALDALATCGYVGVAPISLPTFCTIVRAQSVRALSVTRALLATAFADAVISNELLDDLGPAIASGRAMIFYGHPGTGKSYIARRISRVMNDTILVPHAITVAGQVIQFFDPAFHTDVAQSATRTSALRSTQEFDARFVRCKRPAIVTGGELTLDMLELGFDAATKIYHAPTQLKASNGVFIVDDLGRQRCRPQELLNRWIVPMEERRDFLTVHGTGRFEVPTDIVLVFSTNLQPADLADDAFLRRLGYKIKFTPSSPAEYSRVWKDACASLGIEHDQSVYTYLVDHLYARDALPLLPCHPRDLLGLIIDQCRYHDIPLQLTVERLDQAWKNYFVI